MSQPSRPIEKLPGRGAALCAGVVLATFFVLPAAWLDDALGTSGIALLVPLAAPPLDATARALLALGGAALTAIVIWAALYVLLDAGGFLAAVPLSDGAPSVRRADAHPDAPPRRPLSAAELTGVLAPRGEPTPAPLEQALPVDLDTPLSAFDPAAIPIVPREPTRPVAPLAPGERLRIFALTPPPPAPAPAEAPSIEGLLRRLGQEAGRRVSTR